MTLLYTLCEPEAQLMRSVHQFCHMLLINRAGGNLHTQSTGISDPLTVNMFVKSVKPYSISYYFLYKSCYVF
jgi:hypothetical protein